MQDNEFLIMRHSYDDHSYIDGKNDTSLTSSGIKIAKEAAEQLLFKLDGRDIIVRYSVKKRAKETAEILCERILKTGISVKLIEDKGLTELYQGKFNFEVLDHNQRIAFLQSCWDDFERLRHEGNLKHRFGELKNKEIIIEPGENHAEWSIRVGKAVLNILSDIQSNFQSINVTHRGASLEIKNIIDMANKKIPISEVEKYNTVQMSYCKDFIFKVDDINYANASIKKFINEREKEL